MAKEERFVASHRSRLDNEMMFIVSTSKSFPTGHPISYRWDEEDPCIRAGRSLSQSLVVSARSRHSKRSKQKEFLALQVLPFQAGRSKSLLLS